MNLKSCDVLYGGKLAPWSKPHIRIVQYIIMLVTGGKSHVMLAMYPGNRDDWIIAECTFPEGVRWKRITEIPESYKVYRNPDGFVSDLNKLHGLVEDDNGNPYDFLELLEFLVGKKVVRGFSGKWFVCSTWIQHVLRELGYDPWPDKSATPADFSKCWDKVMIPPCG